MTPCVPSPCDGPPSCGVDGCPPGQTCYRIAEGYVEGYCTWTPPAPGTLVNTPCESPEHDCCCTCADLINFPECAYNIVAARQFNEVDCEVLTQTVLNSNSPFSHLEPFGCCTMTEPETAPNFTKHCMLTGLTVLPCNLNPIPRVPPDPSKPSPLSNFYAPCYHPTALIWDASDPINRPLRAEYWQGLQFYVEGYYPCADNNLCSAACKVFSQCNENPETTADPCSTSNLGLVCYEPEVPSSECAQLVNGACVATCTCEWGAPQVFLEYYSCTGLDPIPYCTFSCPGEPCLYITCPPGYYCDNYATPHCQPISP